MGNFGSTRWGYYSPRYTVEDSLIMAAHPIARQGIHVELNAYASYKTTPKGIEPISMHYSVEPLSEGSDALKLYIKWERPFHSQIIFFETTPPHFGGVRWWFTCPKCCERSNQLYLPPKQWDFACRRCHNLTYESCQRSHTTLAPEALVQGVRQWRERLMTRMGITLSKDVCEPPPAS